MPTPRPEASASAAPAAELARVVGLGGAVLLGLGSILGTGVFVSLGIAAGIAGPWVVVAVLLAALVATANGLSSAQLAARHPVSGGTYEYGYRLLSPVAGFTAGWCFLCAKSASAATAALGLAGYLLQVAGVEGRAARVAGGELLVLALTAVVIGGIRRSNRANALLVGTAVAVLVAMVFLGAAQGARGFAELAWESGEPGTLRDLLEASALVFVAYTGYGRVATLGEEIRDPARNIPRAVIATLVVVMVLYLAVAFVAVGVAGPAELARATESTAAPLERVATRLGRPGLRLALAVAAACAMAGVLLNLVLGLSRVVLAMARRGDLPPGFGRVANGSPRVAVLAVGGVVCALVLVGDVRATWSFSAATVLVYYALTNLAALRLGPAERRFHPAVPVAGLASCLGLLPWIDGAALLSTGVLLAVGLAWHRLRRAARAR